MSDEKIRHALNEAVDALGDIPGENCSEQQRKAYRFCVAARARMNEAIDMGEEKSSQGS